MIKHDSSDNKDNPKYNIGDYVRLIDNEDSNIHLLSKVIEINEDLKVPDYLVETFNKKDNSIIKLWVDEEEISGKMNSKEKQKFISKYEIFKSK